MRKGKDLHKRIAKLSIYGPNKLLEKVRFVDFIHVTCYDSRVGTHQHIVSDCGFVGFLNIFSDTREGYEAIRNELAAEWTLLEG